MRALRVVGVTGDGSVVLEDPGRRERYTVPADEQLRAAARGDVTRLGQIAIELESQLRPREIQARIRGGASVDQVAAAAGVPVQKIERFAYPVLLERSRTAEVAQGAHPQRADGPDIRTLGETVAHTFGLRGQDFTTADWDSWKGEDGKWVVALSWHAGRSDNAAHWAFQPGAHGGTVVALDEHASDLVEGLPARPLRTVGAVVEIGRDDEPEPEPQEPESPRMRAAAAGESRSVDPRRGIAPEQRRASTPPPSRGAAAAPPVASPPAPSAPVSPPAAAEPSASEPGASQPVASRSAESRSAESRSAESRSAASRPDRARPLADDAPATRGGTTSYGQPAAQNPAAQNPAQGGTPTDDDSTGVVPDPPAGRPAAPPSPSGGHQGPEPAGRSATDAAEVEPASQPADGADADAAATRRSAAANRRTKKGKPVMPSWDEVLLGVRGQR